MIMVYDVNKLRSGLKIMQNGEPCIITHVEFVKPGKGQSFNRVRFRKLLSGQMLEKTFKSGDSVELANIEELDLMYLYTDSVYWYFMNLTTYEQTCICSRVVKNNIRWLIEQLSYTIIFWNGNPVFLIPPDFIKVRVIGIQPAIKGNTVSSSVMKIAVLCTGAVVKVPLFIQIGEYIKVDTRSSKYVSRVR